VQLRSIRSQSERREFQWDELENRRTLGDFTLSIEDSVA